MQKPRLQPKAGFITSSNTPVMSGLVCWIGPTGQRVFSNGSEKTDGHPLIRPLNGMLTGGASRKPRLVGGELQLQDLTPNLLLKTDKKHQN
jgi:hypothetical protein